MKSQLIILILLFILTNSDLALGQMDTIYIKPNDLNIDQLKLGTSNYLTYLEMPDGSVKDASIWERTTSIDTFQNDNTIIVKQNWKNQNAKRTRSILSVNNIKTMLPIYQWSKNGKGVVEAFNFYENEIVAADSISENKKKGFRIDLSQPIFNWELDLEILSLLDYSTHRCFAIRFYHPGSSKPPKTEYYSVSKKSKLNLPGDQAVNCWEVSTQYDKNNTTTFWIEETTKQVIKVEDQVGPIRRYKVLIY